MKRGLNIISAYCDAVVVIGFSTGGGLALKLAAQQMSNVVAIAVPIKFVDKSFLFVPLLHGTNRLIKWVSSIEGIKPFLVNQSEHPAINYKNVPVKSLYELRQLIDELDTIMPRIKIPTLIVYADEDPVVDKVSATVIFEKLETKDKKLLAVQSKQHGILMENQGGLWIKIDDFIKRYTNELQF